MEPFSLSLTEMDVDNQVVSVPSSIFYPTPASTTGVTHPHSSPPAPRHMTMRERAQAVREARLKMLSTSPRNQSEGAAYELDTAQHNVSNEPATHQQIALSNAQEAAVVAQGSEVEVNQQQPQPLGPKLQGAEKKSKAQDVGRGKKNQSHKENSATKNAETGKRAPELTEPRKSPDDTNEGGPERPEAIPSGQSTPPKAGSKASRATSTARADRRKRKSTGAVLRDGKDVSENDSDIVFVRSNLGSTSPRARKKARVVKAKAALPPKAPPKGQKKKKGKRAVQSHATTTAPSPHINVDSQQQGEVEVSSKKRKSLRSSSRIVDEGTPAGVQDKKINKSNREPPSKDPQTLGTIEEDPKPHHMRRRWRSPERKSKRLMNRQRKDPNPVELEPPGRFDAIEEEENWSTAQTDREEPNPDLQSQRTTKSRRRKAKQNAPNEAESAKKARREDDNEFDSSKVNTPLRRSLRSAAKSKPPVEPPVEQKNKSGHDLEATDMLDDGEVGSHPAIPAEKEVHDKGSVNPATQSASKAKRASPKERALQSVTKSKRFALSASQQGARFVQPRDSTMSGSRRQSLSHREGLSRLTSVVDQLQREGEAFLETEHRICDQLMPFSSDSGSHKVSNLVQGYFGTPVSDDHRKAIADSALRDAVLHAKLQFQTKQRAAITELAENLVKAMRDWKNAKNTVLRDIIPEELRPENEAPIEPFQQRMRAVDDMSSAPENSEITAAPNENGVDEEEEQSEGLSKGGTHKIAMRGDGDVTFGKHAIRRDSISGIRVLENANELKQFVGFAYSDLDLKCYRSCAILKLCEFEQGLSFDELYSVTPLGKVMLKKKLAFLVGSKYLHERRVEMSAGNTVVVYHTAPHIVRRERRV